jgi:FKBP-type peptidyl-prolyl cis-trans isomerase 2
MHKAIKASQLQPGMTMAFSNPRHNYLIDDVRTVRDGEIRVDHGDYTAIDFYRADETVWILED